MTIPIDTRDYEKIYGVQPMGRRFWAFRIVTNTAIQKYRTSAPMTYTTACEEVTKRAEALGAASIIVDEN